MNLTVLNKYNKLVNVLHFQGRNIEQLPKTFNKIYDECELEPLEEDLTLISCWTDDNKCCLKKQLDKFNIPILNAVPEDYDKSLPWYMPNKIHFILNALKTKTNTNIVMILDGYDVLMSSTKDIVKKFKSQKYHILFNSTVNNYPEVYVDNIPNRFEYDEYMMFFNAGCCIGYKDDLIKFYERCLDYINVPNNYNSEQLICRCVFSEYSEDETQDYIFVDFNHDIFQTMGLSKIVYNEEYNMFLILDNLLPHIVENQKLYNTLKQTKWYRKRLLPAIQKIRGES